MLNTIAIMGRLVADPELRQTPAGKNVVSFRIACDRGRKDLNGQNQVDWLDVVAWERTAEFVSKYFVQGNLIAITGRLQTRQYTDKQGNKRTAVEVVAAQVDFCGGKGEQGEQRATGYAPPKVVPATRDDFALIEGEEDLPF